MTNIPENTPLNHAHVDTASGKSLSLKELLWQEGGIDLFRSSFGGSHDLSVITTSTEGAAVPGVSARLIHASNVRKHLATAWAAVPTDFIEIDGRPVLVCNDPGGMLLATLVGVPWEPGRFLRAAIAVTRAVGAMHDAGVIHRDIKPSNILLDEENGAAWLLGFTIASTVRHDPYAENTAKIAGTLAYMSPEQTGGMTRQIDIRSDLYCLGISLYEVLAGVLPFRSTNPSELIHSHLARLPAAPDEFCGRPGEILSEIILCLIAKAPEDRYQSAGALEADLRRALSTWITEEKLSTFPLLRQARARALPQPSTLHGRAAQSKTLKSSLNRARTNAATELVLVAGYSGSGKSMLAAELAREAAPDLIFATGKFDLHQRNVPYSAMHQVCDALLAQLRTMPTEEQNACHVALTQVLSERAALLTAFVPSLASALGLPGVVETRVGESSQSDFYQAFCRFLQVFASSERPLALFFDDLQWADPATLQFLAAVVSANAVHHLLIIAAYRDNEAARNPALVETLALLYSAGERIRAIETLPLEPHALSLLIAEVLGCTLGRAADLCPLVLCKTGGNPFFVMLFLNALVDEGLMTAEAGTSNWQWDTATIEATGFTDNVGDLMASRLQRLSPTSRRVLAQLACLGHCATPLVIAVSLKLSVVEIEIAMWEAMDAGLVERTELGLAFSHDRVLEAAYGLNAASALPAIHLEIGRALYAGFDREERKERAFEIANHVNRGLKLVHASGERMAFAQLNHDAGMRARGTTAYAAALDYFATAYALLDGATWETAFDLAFNVMLRRGEAEFLTGYLVQAEATLAQLALRVDSAVDRAAVASMQINLFTAAGGLQRAIDICLHFLRDVGEDWSVSPSTALVWKEYAAIAAVIDEGRVEDLVALPALTDPVHQATLQILVAVLPAAFFSNQNLVCLILCRITNISIRWGNADASALGYAYLGMVLGPFFGNYDAGFRFGQLGNDLVGTGRFDRFKARVHMCFAYHVMPWTKHIAAGMPLLRQAFDEACASGDLTYTGFSSCTLITSQLAAGNHLREVDIEAEAKCGFIHQAKFELIERIIATQLQMVRALRGMTADPGSFDDGTFSERAFESTLLAHADLAIAQCWYWIRKMQLSYFAGNHAVALDACHRAEPLLWTTAGHFEFAEFHFYAALTHAKCCDTGDDNARAGHIEALRRHLEQHLVWARSGPDTFACRASLVSGEWARVSGNKFDALQCYETSIAQAKRGRFVYVEGLACESAGSLCLQNDMIDLAQSYLKRARHAYRAWGAEGKVRQLTLLYAGLLGEMGGAQPCPTIGASLDSLDVAAVVRTSEAISGQVGLPRLISTLMSIVLEHSGADRAILVMPRQDALQVEGEANMRQDVIDIARPQVSLATFDAPTTLIDRVVNSRNAIAIDDAQAANLFAADPYFARKVCRSIFCFPLLKQGKLIGLLYLENNLAPHIFTAARQGMLNLLATQAAILLENASLEENGALLKEVHHRVKNNLQLISSLLSLQAGTIADPQVAELFNESRNRVRAMALVHENLYRAGNFARVPMLEHVNMLCRQIARAYGLGALGVNLVVKMDSMQLDLNRAVSCGLLINELVTNALKHAFPDRASGEVCVEMRCAPHRMCSLTVSDNGAGIRHGLLRDDGRSLGMQLISDLNDQLQGTMQVLSGPDGTQISISFSLEVSEQLA